tara:strand:- start:4751 stop:5266 length:516 start_codon:yes stop_codon:yes gene_type:complete
MHPKISKWLSISTRLLQARISSDTENSTQFMEELNLRRETISNTHELLSAVTNKSIEGTYQIIGANSENAEQGYFGILTLKYDDNKIFATWLIEGEDTQTGFGLFVNKILSINFVYQQDGVEYTGLVSYEFLSEKILSGIWVEMGSDEIGVEYGRKLPVKREDPLKHFSFN